MASGENVSLGQGQIEELFKRGPLLDKTVYGLLRLATLRAGDKIAIVEGALRLTYAQVLEATNRVVTVLRAIGIGHGDIVAVQLPNRHQFPLIEYALSAVGAVCVPLSPIYRGRELRAIFSVAKPKAMIGIRKFRNFDYVPLYRELGDAFGIENVLLVDGRAVDGFADFDALCAAAPPAQVNDAVDPNSVSEIAFTSGTTGEPKGAIHTHNTNLRPLMSVARRSKLRSDEVILMASTFGHQTGFCYGGQLPILLGGTLVLMDTWNGEIGLELINREKVTWMMGATPFLQDLIWAAEKRGSGAPSLRNFFCSGAPIPEPLLRHAYTCLECVITTGWGMTEVGAVTLTAPEDAPELIMSSDGFCLDGMEVRVIDAEGHQILDQEGDILCRGPSLFAGYFARSELTRSSFDEEGWFRTGDRGILRSNGYLRISGRSKDIVIRGGENIPVAEIENVIYRHPKVTMAAIVAMPDPRLQERACAFLVLEEGQDMTFAELCHFLTEQEVARPYHPERLEIRDRLPMTPSGKIQKFALREQIRTQLAQESSTASDVRQDSQGEKGDEPL
jgi:cyclohexanecarboxylate-CoA ligase